MARTVDVEVTVKGGREFFNTHSYKRPSYYLLLTLNAEKNRTVCGEKGDKAPKWDQNFVFAADLDSILHVKVLCTHDRGEGYAIGQTDINILKIERNKDVEIAFHRKDKKSGEMIIAGYITLYLKVAVSVTFAVQGSKASLRSLHHLNQMDNVLKIMNTTEGYQLSPTWKRLIMSLDTVVSYAENISELDSRATVAVSAVAFMVQVLVKQVERDEKVENLGVVMADLYTYIRDGIEMDKIETYQKILDKVLTQTTECAYFIAEYRKVKLFAQRAVINIVSDADNIIAQFEAFFGELKISLILGSSLQTAVVSYRILQTVENIESLIHVNNLPYLKNVGWDSGRTCLRGTRQELIDEIVQWVSSSGSVDQKSAKHIYVLAGPPGCGKSTVAHTIAEAFHEHKRLGASLFLRGHSGPVNSQTVSSSIIHQLAQYNTVIKARIAEALKSDPSLTDADIGQQFRHLLVGVINTGAPNDDAALAMIGPILIVLDNLHEISEKGEQERILTAIAEDFLKLPPNFRLLLTSRSRDTVIDVFDAIPDHCHIREVTYDNPRGEAPDVFMTSSLERLPQLKDCPSLGEMHKSLLERSMGIQTWIDILFRFLFFCRDRELWLPGAWQTLHQILSSPIPLSKENAMDSLYRAIFSSFPYPTSLVKDLLLSFLSVGPLSLTEAHKRISLKCIEFTKVIGEDHSRRCPILQVMQELGFVISEKGKSGKGKTLCALSPLLLDSLTNERRCHGTLFPGPKKAVMTIKIMNDEFRLGRWKKLGNNYKTSAGNYPQADLQRSCLSWISCIESCGVECMDDRITEFDPLFTVLEEFLAGPILGWMHCLAILAGTSPSLKQMRESLLQRFEYWLECHISATSITGVELRLCLLLQDVRRIRGCDFYSISCQKNHSTSEASKEAYSSTFINIAKEQPVCYRDTEYPTVVYRIDRSWLPNRNCVVLRLTYRQRLYHYPAPMGSFRRWASVTRKLPTLSEAIGHARIKKLTFRIFVCWDAPPEGCRVDAEAVIIHDLQPGPKFSRDALATTASMDKFAYPYRPLDSGQIVASTTTNPGKWHLGEISYGNTLRVVWTAKGNGFVSLLAPGDRIGVIVGSKIFDDVKEPRYYQVQVEVLYVTET
ncbi:hypothetical protein CPC08DRAFT_296570 [Agrocybe pediades]|nr:hypothetical protein CPC08DRAFT_296570 [Agrocybe pediades]